ncbi:hypothetical protein [Virgibacillus sp. SK37]|uniref:hypothetical protein n=1 Tax=Virgibacillus sp. SK37 TaxID=403957 RepID=UPI0004D1C02C|nr:hypothetical protein [Virgibacillus sp. SK37]AIF43141.1 hypothetical protein X953_08220 [Virgibacillus sp. SK37]
MSVQHYHNLCQRYRGRAVEIRTHRGDVHRGIIKHVDRQRVYLEPFGGGQRNLGGFGFGFYGPGGGYGGYGYRPGFGYGLALGAIGTLALLPFFFW